LYSLKPENILIDCDGYAKLTDFGLSKDNIYSSTGGHASSICGTQEYLAPEVLSATKQRAYGQSCDWWSFGCVLYEMLTAMPPFYSKKREQLFEMIRTRNPNFYSYHSPDAVDLISKLLVKDPTKRLTDPSEIKCHPFFQEIDWRAMTNKEMRTPYKPLLESTDDTKHFDQDICHLPLNSPTKSS
jgi:serine/threonine protein kinase